MLPPLNTPVAQVIKEIKNEDFIKWPRKIKTKPLKRNKNKYCEFHKDHRHNTEDCFQLKEKIADLIKRRYLRKYLAYRPPSDSPDRGYANNRLTVGDIQTIHRGFASRGCSSSSRKRHAKEASGRAEKVYNLSAPMIGAHRPITFTKKDLRGLHIPHDDALVISTTITNFNVQRIRVDNGSSTDILFISAFVKIGIGQDGLHPFHTPLVRIGGGSMSTFGWIKLPMTACHFGVYILSI